MTLVPLYLLVLQFAASSRVHFKGDAPRDSRVRGWEKLKPPGKAFCCCQRTELFRAPRLEGNEFGEQLSHGDFDKYNDMTMHMRVQNTTYKEDVKRTILFNETKLKCNKAMLYMLVHPPFGFTFTGSIITNIEPNSSASAAGLPEKSVVESINGIEIPFKPEGNDAVVVLKREVANGRDIVLAVDPHPEFSFLAMWPHYKENAKKEIISLQVSVNSVGCTWRKRRDCQSGWGMTGMSTRIDLDSALCGGIPEIEIWNKSAYPKHVRTCRTKPTQPKV